MKRHSPNARQYMTHLPVELERCESAADARGMMRQHGIHHLPVMNGSRLHGVVTEKSLLQAQIRLGKSFGETPLHELCQSELVIVSPVDAIDQVVSELLDRGVDHAVVMDGGFVVGILTTVDVLRFVREHFGGSADHD